jgi:uncharacterized protein (DUF885 family)
MDSNTIYINQGSDYSILELFTTLAHEGYPGHLYQTVYFGNACEDPVRNVLNFGGYVEGWATYVEMCSYEWFAEWAGDNNSSELQILADLCRLNRSLNLGIASYLDIAVHDHGSTREQVAAVLRNVGYESGSAADALYDTLLESPANYLKYYVGYLSFLDLRDEAKEKEGDSFSLQDFHKKILELGPASFRVVREYI